MLSLSKDLLLRIHDLMVRSRVLEDRMIKIYKSGQAYFWIGGPGEEGFGVPLGLLVQKGSGVNYDYLHLHYRSSSTLIAMGMPFETAIRLIMNKATDMQTGGRLFASHYCYPQWNVMPVTSPIEVQYFFSNWNCLGPTSKKIPWYYYSEWRGCWHSRRGFCYLFSMVFQAQKTTAYFNDSAE